ncbi:seleno protein W-related protein [Umbelopsis sp. PMI_123]|nr:seleno protein W-related protein [Umbelopsis sp. PMI_123]
MSSTSKNPRVSIEYCTQCRWMLRSAWMAQELLTTFESTIGEVALIPGKSGVFRVMVNDVLIWDRKEMQSFPDIKHLKQLVRDIIDPTKQLGHSDRKDVKSDPEPKKNDISSSASDPKECLTCVE